MSHLGAGARASRGILIAIEGIDGAGKTTQASLLREALEKDGYNVVCLKEPGKTVYGDKIREAALKGRLEPREEFELFLKDRMEDVKNNIKPALEAGKIVIMDRYYFSNIAYQGAMGLDPLEIQIKNEEIAPKPDLTIILDINPREAVQRIKNSRKETPNEFEKENYLAKVRAIFKGMTKENKASINPFLRDYRDKKRGSSNITGFKIIDGSKKVEEIRAEILDAVRNIDFD